jgi:predicted protein tyrosine phosphatase
MIDRIYVLDRETICRQNPAPHRHVIISISTPGDPVPEIITTERTRAVLRLQFDDVDQRGLQYSGWCTFLGREWQPFTPAQAGQISGFCAALQQDVISPVAFDIVVHCDAGVSRSAAVAEVLSEVFDNTPIIDLGYRCPNDLVARLLRVAFGLLPAC